MLEEKYIKEANATIEESGGRKLVKAKNLELYNHQVN